MKALSENNYPLWQLSSILRLKQIAKEAAVRHWVRYIYPKANARDATIVNVLDVRGVRFVDNMVTILELLDASLLKPDCRRNLESFFQEDFDEFLIKCPTYKLRKNFRHGGKKFIYAISDANLNPWSDPGRCIYLFGEAIACLDGLMYEPKKVGNNLMTDVRIAVERAHLEKNVPQMSTTQKKFKV